MTDDPDQATKSRKRRRDELDQFHHEPKRFEPLHDHEFQINFLGIQAVDGLVNTLRTVYHMTCDISPQKTEVIYAIESDEFGPLWFWQTMWAWKENVGGQIGHPRVLLQLHSFQEQLHLC